MFLLCIFKSFPNVANLYNIKCIFVNGGNIWKLPVNEFLWFVNNILNNTKWDDDALMIKSSNKTIDCLSCKLKDSFEQILTDLTTYLKNVEQMQQKKEEVFTMILLNKMNDVFVSIYVDKCMTKKRHLQCLYDSWCLFNSTTSRSRKIRFDCFISKMMTVDKFINNPIISVFQSVHLNVNEHNMDMLNDEAIYFLKYLFKYHSCTERIDDDSQKTETLAIG